LLWNAFTAEGITNEPQPGPEDTNPVVDAALNFVARTESPLCLDPLADVLGQEEQPNLPGTVNEHPNWRRRQAVRAAELLDQDSVIGRVQMLAKERPRL
jgi:4-alpha-glucanotransferase